MAISTLSIAKSVGLTDYYKKPFREEAGKDLWPMNAVWTIGSTKRGQEKMYGMAGLPMASERGEQQTPLVYDPVELGDTTLTIKKFFIGARASREALTDSDRNLGDFAGQIGSMLGESLSQATSSFASLFFNRITSTTYPAFDALGFASSTHALEDGSTYDNLFTASTNTYDNVMADISAYRWGYRTHAGGYKYDDVASIMVAPAQEVAMQKLFENTSGEPDNADRNDNFLRLKNIKIIVNPFLSSTTGRVFLGKNFKKHAFFLWREKMQDDQEPDKSVQGVVFFAWQRCGYAVDDYLPLAYNPGA